MIEQAGQLGSLLAYIYAGLVLYFVVTSLGEMATCFPVEGSFKHMLVDL